ncbi:MAG: hypothetical protein RJB38_2374 [Pseudomonadota bacterium]|jgi:DNA-binding transcriptional LysR family regulator
MDIYRLRYLVSVIGTGSFKKAAELHRISPPAMSKAMRTLEAEIGEPLFLEDGRGIRSTDRARELVAEVAPLLSQLEEAFARRGTPASIPAVRIGTFEVFSTYVLTQSWSEIFNDRPLQATELVPGEMEQALAAGRVDLCLSYLPIPHAEVEWQQIAQVQMKVFGHPSLQKTWNPKTTPFAVPIQPLHGTPSRVQGLDGWPEDRHPRHRKFEVSLMETALGLCRQRLAVAYLPEFIARLHNELVLPKFRLVEMPTPTAKPTPIYIGRRRSMPESEEHKKLARLVRQVVRGS